MVQVPAFINEGEKIRVSTSEALTRNALSRAKKRFQAFFLGINEQHKGAR